MLFNEDPAYSHIYYAMFKVIQKRDESITFEKLLQDRDELIKDGHILPLKVLIAQTLTEDENSYLRNEFKVILEDEWLKYNPLIPEAPDILKNLGQFYNIGIIANGPSFLRAIMQEAGIKQYLKVIVTSEETGIPKPNKGIFLEAFQQAEEYCDSRHETFIKTPMIMVGDSLEQDILPAKQNGMIGVQLLWDLDEKYKNSGLLTDSTFNLYLQHLKKHSSRKRKPENQDETPDYIVQTIQELESLLLSPKFKQKMNLA